MVFCSTLVCNVIIGLRNQTQTITQTMTTRQMIIWKKVKKDNPPKLLQFSFAFSFQKDIRIFHLMYCGQCGVVQRFEDGHVCNGQSFRTNDKFVVFPC